MANMKKRSIACALLALAGAAMATDTLTVSWREKAPYHYTDNGVEKGFLLERGKLVFARAGVPAQFVEEPTKRIWSNFQSGKRMYCSLGRYRLPERDLLAQYSEPIHFDPPQAVLAAPGALERVRSHRTLASLMNDASLSVGTIDGVSYGPRIDELIHTMRGEVVRRTVDSGSLIRMVAVGRVSFTFADRYGWEYQREHEPALAVVTAVEFADAPAGLARYIMCSKDVPASIMRKLNRAIESIPVSERSGR
jgi:uncharacterized protein (TIGR02285 family)